MENGDKHDRNDAVARLSPGANGGDSARSASQYVVQAPGVCGGDQRIAGTRIPVWAVEDARRRGLDDATILAMYPVISPEMLEAAQRYAESHLDEIDRLIAENAGA